MYKIFKIVLAVFLIFFSFTGIALADEKLTFNELVENGKVFDKKQVKISGEAIGEALKRGSYTWINISDGTLPMGIWMRSEDADKVKVFGDYHNKGDLIEITGTFNRACSEHGGDMDIHADSVVMVKEGERIAHPLEYRRFIISIGLTLLTVMLGALTYRKIKME
ncbi:MAG: hypothetical protein K0R09_1282 [Clostridiales bacterium]|jgi:hypothetical protein|nr:hypothetical protein [Clostridiales bacterium]